jgi:RNA polymerase sigma-70 factor (ECF subfamily)
MPPLLTWFTGRQTVTGFIEAHFLTEPGGLWLVPVLANGERAFAVYRRDPDGAYHAHALLVPTVTATGIVRIIAFQDTRLFGSFGLPQEFRAGSGPAPA